MATTCNQQGRLLGRNKEKIQVLPSHNDIIILPRTYPINLDGKIPKIVLRMQSEDNIWSINATGHEGSAD